MHLLHRLTAITLLIVSLSSFALGQTADPDANALFNEARALAWQSDASKKRLALKKFQEAARRFREAGATYNELAAYLGAGMVASELKEYRLARDLCAKSLPLFDPPERKHDRSIMLFNVGTYSILIGDRAAAIEYFTTLVKLYEELGENSDQAYVESDLGALYYQSGDYDKALHFLELALVRRKKLGKACDTAATWTNIGAVQIAKGEWTKAVESLKQQALPLYNTSTECALGTKYPKNTECPDYLAGTLINIGKLYYDLADYKSARCFYERAEPLVTYKDFKAALMNNLGTIDYKLGNYRSALAQFRQAKDIHAGVAAEALTNIALAQPAQEKVLATLAEALRLRREVGNENGEAVTLNGLGEVYNRLGRPKDALESLNRAIGLFQSAGDRGGEATALSNAMLSWRRLGNRKMAISNGRLAVDRFHELRVEARALGEIERTYLRTIRQAYRNLAELLIEEGLHEQAIHVLTLYRGAQSFGPAQSIDVTQLIRVQQTLPAVTLYTLAGENRIYVLAVTRGGIKVFSRAIASHALDQKVKNFLDALHCADRDPFRPGAELYDLIFRSTLISDKQTTLEGILKNDNTTALLWSLDRPLNAIPMAALYDAATKQFLIEKYQTAVFTRSDEELFKRELKPWLHGIGLGTSTQFTGLDPIRGAEASLAAIFGDKATKQTGVLTGKTVVNKQFTAKTLENLDGQWPLVHVVSHFVLTAGDSRSSFLLLGDGERYSLAKMRETPDLFAGVELLAVPICDTAVHDSDYYGKEIETMADLAQRLGANSVLASLWKVSYDVTPKLMLRFYELAQAHRDWSKAELLRQAQLSLLRGEIRIDSNANVTRGQCGPRVQSRSLSIAKAPFAHPFYWSAFVLYGNGR